MTCKKCSKATLGCWLVLIAALVFLGSCGGGSTSSLSTPATSNTASITVGFGALGAAGGYVNGAWTTVTVCAPGSTTNCQTIDNVLVDTGSAGLRVLDSVLTTVPASSLGAITYSGDQLQECVQYGDTSYTWGPVMLANVEIAGETAASVPIQVIGGGSAEVPAQCLAMPVNPTLPNGGDDDTLATLGANGILGVGAFGYPYDCGSGCTDSSNLTVSGYPYYVCPSGQACSPVTTSTQTANPMVAFSTSDNNGVLITLPSVPAAGAADGTVTGSLIFGIGSQSDNALASTATVYALDEYGDIPTFTYNGVSYTSPTNYSVLDTGSEAIAFLDSTTLAPVGIVDCMDAPSYYCPSSAIAFTVSATGATSTSGTISFSIMNADTLFGTNNSAFNDLAGPSGTSPANDYFDFGLPFFFGRTVYVGMTPGLSLSTTETPPPSAASSATYGYYAF